MDEFITRPSPRIAFGSGMLAKLPEFVRDVGSVRPLLVTDKGIRSAGHLDRALSVLKEAGIEVSVFDDVQENPTNACIFACMRFAAEAGIDSFIGMGGGSSMDTAKGCNFLLTNGGEMKDYHGYGKADKPMLPFIAIPTTSGTGSECQSYALVSDDATHVKMACGDAKALASVALLDPELTASQPHRVAILTGLDAMAHAVETAVCRPRNPISKIHSMEAFRLMASSIESVIAGDAQLLDRSNMQMGAALAGLAIESSMLGAAHASANPLTAYYDVTHGHAVAIMLPHVIRFNRNNAAANEIYQSYEKWIPGNEQENVDMADWFESLIDAAGLSNLSALGAAESDVSKLAEAATQQWTGRFNPRTVGQEEFEELYQSALERIAESA
ncbi:MAG: iron-containing alcohol dehydrogenase [Opitutaceae bacterium]|nr:iron-containing alcohol dehydrogenase [Opitutaceae bacterium]